MKKKLMIIGCAIFIQGCSTQELEEGSRVEVVTHLDVDKRKCKNLGPVFGKGGGMFGGAWLADEKLMGYASNSMRNQAGKKGATHVVVMPHAVGNTSGEYGGTTSTMTQQGIAYYCPETK